MPRVAFINQAAARTLWPDHDAVGKRVYPLQQSNGNRESFHAAPVPWTTIVGVFADARTESLADTVVPKSYGSVYLRSSKSLVVFLRAAT